jgi:hypothetical protein
MILYCLIALFSHYSMVFKNCARLYCHYMILFGHCHRIINQSMILFSHCVRHFSNCMRLLVNVVGFAVIVWYFLYKTVGPSRVHVLPCIYKKRPCQACTDTGSVREWKFNWFLKFAEFLINNWGFSASAQLFYNLKLFITEMKIMGSTFIQIHKLSIYENNSVLLIKCSICLLTTSVKW